VTLQEIYGLNEELLPKKMAKRRKKDQRAKNNIPLAKKKNV